MKTDKPCFIKQIVVYLPKTCGNYLYICTLFMIENTYTFFCIIESVLSVNDKSRMTLQPNRDNNVKKENNKM